MPSTEPIRTIEAHAAESAPTAAAAQSNPLPASDLGIPRTNTTLWSIGGRSCGWRDIAGVGVADCLLASPGGFGRSPVGPAIAVGAPIAADATTVTMQAVILATRMVMASVPSS